jgi:hypothetical protein
VDGDHLSLRPRGWSSPAHGTTAPKQVWAAALAVVGGLALLECSQAVLGEEDRAAAN